MKIAPEDVVVIVLHTPREKLLATVKEIEPAGVFFRGIDLGYFDDWCTAISSGEPHLPMADQFVPMWRVERILRDEDAFGSPAMSAQFEQRTGLRFSDQ